MKLRNMEEKISYRLFLMGFVGLVCTAALCIFIFHRAFTKQAWTALENEASLVAVACQLPDAAEHLEDFAPADLRLTLIASDGSVIFDSDGPQQMENHLSRPENPAGAGIRRRTGPARLPHDGV